MSWIIGSSASSSKQWVFRWTMPYLSLVDNFQAGSFWNRQGDRVWVGVQAASM